MRLGDSHIVPFRHQSNRQITNGEKAMPRLATQGGVPYRKRVLVLVLMAAALWILVCIIARMLFH